jgi:hypothetical protein
MQCSRKVFGKVIKALVSVKNWLGFLISNYLEIRISLAVLAASYWPGIFCKKFTLSFSNFILHMKNFFLSRCHNLDSIFDRFGN